MRPNSPTTKITKNYQPANYIRSTLEPNKNQSPYRIKTPKSPTAHNMNNLSSVSPTSSPMLSYSVPNLQKLNMTDHMIVNHHSSPQNNTKLGSAVKQDDKLKQLLNRNKSNEHIITNGNGVSHTQNKLFVPPLLSQGLRYTIDPTFQVRKQSDQHIKQQNSPQNRTNFKKLKQNIQDSRQNLPQRNYRYSTVVAGGSRSVVNRLPKSVNSFRILKRMRFDAISQHYLAIQKSTYSIWNLRIIKKSILKNRQQSLNRLISQLKYQYFTTHPFILQIYDIFVQGQCIYIVQQFIESGNLQEYTSSKKEKENYSEDQIGSKVSEICSALEHLHSNERIQGSLSPSNILITMNTCKISGSQLSSNKIPNLATLASSFNYISPETFLQNCYTKASDMWALGLIIYFLCTGQPLFKNQTNKEIIDSILNFSHESFSFPQDNSENINSIISNLVQSDVNSRMSSSDIMKSPLIESNCYEKQWTETAQILYGDVKNGDSGLKIIKKNPIKLGDQHYKNKHKFSLSNQVPAPSFLNNKKTTQLNQQSKQSRQSNADNSIKQKNTTAQSTEKKQNGNIGTIVKSRQTMTPKNSRSNQKFQKIFLKPSKK